MQCICLNWEIQINHLQLKHRFSYNMFSIFLTEVIPTAFGCRSSTVKVLLKVGLYSAVSIPLDRSKRFTRHPWSTCSFRHQLDFYGKHSATLQSLRKDYSFTFSPLCIARYSFIQLSELGMASWRERICHHFKRVARGIWTGERESDKWHT